MKKNQTGITKELFMQTKIECPEGGQYLGCWINKGFIIAVYKYKNGAKLRLTYWIPAEMVLACAKDYYGNYHCLSSNVKSMEELQEIITQFDWRKYDAKKQRQRTVGTLKHEPEQATDKREIAGILNNLNELNNDNSN